MCMHHPKRLESTCDRNRMKQVAINDDEIFIATCKSQPVPQSGGSNQPLPDSASMRMQIKYLEDIK